MRFGTRFISIPCLLLIVQNAMGQLKDTSLLTLHSKPFFFNVLKGEGNQIFAGTSEGIFRMEGSSCVKEEDRIGYITLDERGRLQIDSNGIKYHEDRSFSRMLPFPDMAREEYHAGTEEYFYIVAGGRMHVYEILPYGIIYPNHSVRTVSGNFTGTYSGIYYRGRRLEQSPIPKFCDGYIREINRKAFICYSSLIIMELHGGDSLPTILDPLPGGFNYDYTSDILFSKSRDCYFLATKNQLGTIDRELTTARPVYTRAEKHGEVVLLGEDRTEILFASGNELMSYRRLTDSLRVLTGFPEQILDGKISRHNIYILSAKALYVTNHDGRMEKLTGLNKAHTLLNLGKSEWVIATDAGLFLYNMASGKLSTLIQGVEFNRRGLHLIGDRLYAGSINGLYVLDVNNQEQLANRSSKTANDLLVKTYWVPSMAALILLVVLFAFLLRRSRNRLKKVIEEYRAVEKSYVRKEDIENFIRENLAMASLKSINERFNTSTSNLYIILDPEKPGAFINRLRMDQVIRMRKENKSAREISEQTGFSESYVRKVWNQPAG